MTILTIDQGTTSTRAIVYDADGSVLAVRQRPVSRTYPQPGWVEQDAEEIWDSVRETIAALPADGFDLRSVQSVGITNQRETTVLWDRSTGKSVAPAIVWQSRQSEPVCERLRAQGAETELLARTGLPLDPYFSAGKWAWQFEREPHLRERAARGEVLAGTVDSWLVWKLTGEHATDASNASRTQLFNIHTLDWDDELLSLFAIPRACLPEVRPTAGSFGTIRKEHFGFELPISAVVGDQQAALFGQRCYAPGETKVTYGTGCFLLMQTGETPVESNNGLLTTVAWQKDGRTHYALEGSVYNAGSAVQWLRDGLGLLTSAQESEWLASSVPDAGGVIVVPAFVGLGAPYWDAGARGAVFGLTQGTTRAHLARAVLEAVALQATDVLSAMREDSGRDIRWVRADGGAAANAFLLQAQADYTGVKVARPVDTETTARGAAMLAGLESGFWTEDDLARHDAQTETFEPKWDTAQREAALARWHHAVAATRAFRAEE